ncbi:DUF1329 domain-containing protein [Opitutus sp. ER46]|uniref:DUF1329 domain-containing protein n=1 Tax=Opitutus sp. ER46 TaxID=2161864 RepID=UPI000D3164C4|nr:DUF1329 domain-containing protein [Opitutus sp. ER46]PTX94303.1 DUF1329 domain-containing protein [Opitutus sp. ER46]
MKIRLLFVLSCAAVAASATRAAVSEAEAARLGKDLTPMGAEAAGNAAGTIPAWNGGIMTPPAGYKPGDHHPDPFAADQPLYTITAANMAEHAEQLTAGHQALLKAYPTYKMVVYPTRRSASYPQRIYDATRANATTGQIVANGNGISNATIGVPFPIPQSGIEVVWNFLTRFRGYAAVRYIDQAAVERGGGYQIVKFEDEFLYNYSRPDITVKELDEGNVLVYFKQATLAPARLAGTILVVWDSLNQVKEPRRAWQYNAGRRRVTRAPNVAYDNPGTNADGQRTTDQFDFFSGAPDRYEWKLLGKKEMLVPYNSYKLHAKGLKASEILKPLHINQDLARYELHRVWVVDATLKPGVSHLYSRRTFYIDEDSWQILAADHYDGRGQMWRPSEAHCINYYDAPTFWSTLEVIHDLQNNRYLALGLDNENAMYDFTLKRAPSDYTPESLRREGVR